MEKMKDKILFFFNKGLFHILGTSIVNNIIQFLTNIFVVNLVAKSEYGVYTYANNIISIFLLIRGLGLCSGLIQFASEQSDDNKRQEIYKYTLIRGNQYNLILTLVLGIWATVSKLKIENAREYLLAMLFVPILQWLFDYVTTVFRVKEDNILYARITNINTIFYFLFSLVGARFFGVYGIIMGRYFSFIFSIFIAAVWLQKDIVSFKNYKPRLYEDKKEITKYSITACANNSLSEVLYLLDVFLIGVFVANPDYIASYKVATQIPTALAFIPLGIMTFIYPYFAAHNRDMNWVKANYYKLLRALIFLNGIICIGLFISAPLIIRILWGEEYLDSLIPFRILAVNYFFLGTFRIPCGNILAMLRKININFIISIIASLVNILLDIILIKTYGSIGAALATLFVVLISGGLAFVYLVFYIHSNTTKKESNNEQVGS